MSWFDNLHNAVDETIDHIGKIATMLIEKDKRIAELERQLAEAQALISEYEWSSYRHSRNGGQCCPECGELMTHGHADDCRMAKALKGSAK